MCRNDENKAKQFNELKEKILDNTEEYIIFNFFYYTYININIL